MAARTHRWVAGDVFLVPLKDGTHGVGQVVARDRSLLRSAAIALFDLKADCLAGQGPHVLPLGTLFSELVCTRDLLDSGRWAVVGRAASPVPEDVVAYEALRASGFVGESVVGSAIVEEFVNAYFGLMPWDDWYVPDYLDKLLVSPGRKPVHRLLFSGRHGPGPDSRH